MFLLVSKVCWVYNSVCCRYILLSVLQVLRAVSVKNGAPRTWVDFVQICDYVYELGFGEKLWKITIKFFSSHLGGQQLLRASQSQYRPAGSCSCRNKDIDNLFPKINRYIPNLPPTCLLVAELATVDPASSAGVQGPREIALGCGLLGRKFWHGMIGPIVFCRNQE